MAISYYDFKNLPDHSQQELVMTEGKLINETIKRDLKFLLYQVSSFTVEIVYNMNNNRIASLNAYQNNGINGNNG
jgi:hypothetical protein